MSRDELRQSLPGPQQRHLDPAAPLPARMMAARALLPLPPREQVIVLCGATLDAATEVSAAAASALAGLPDRILASALEAGLPRAALRILTPLAAGRDELLERLVLGRDTPDEAIALVAAGASERIAELIASDQERCLRSEAIVRALRANPHLLRSSRDRLFDFLLRAGVVYEDMPELAEAMARLAPAEMEAAAARVLLPAEVSGLLEETADASERAHVASQALESRDEGARERVPVLKLIASLGVSQRVALAIKGNKEARAILVRDMNRVVASAAIRNPRITEQEVATAAQSRSVSDEVIRIISTSKELSRAYAVKVALVNNPKTPLPTAMRLLSLLRDADIRSVAKSKNVSAAVANQAKRLVAAKQPGGAR